MTEPGYYFFVYPLFWRIYERFLRCLRRAIL
jgi:hypothetical protein